MCQIHEAHAFALKTNRTLILDTRLSGLADALSHYLILQNNTCQIELELSPENLKKINNLSCYPPKIAGKVEWIFHRFWAIDSKKGRNWPALGAIKPLWHLLTYLVYRFKSSPPLSRISFLLYFIKLKGASLAIDLHSLVENKSEVIIHHMSGGGEGSLEAIKLFKLTHDIRHIIQDKIKTLGPNYVAIHIRHTDYRTNYRGYLPTLKSELKGERVLICSDNYEVINYTKELFDESIVLHFIKNQQPKKTPSNHLPLHFQWDLSSEEIYCNNVAMLTDLIALAKAKKLYTTRLTENGLHLVSLSGFSALAANLNAHPDILQNWVES